MKIARLSPLQDFQPIRNVGGVIFAGLKRQFKIGTEESGAQFRNEFLLRIGVAAEAVAAEVAVKAVFAPLQCVSSCAER